MRSSHIIEQPIAEPSSPTIQDVQFSPTVIIQSLNNQENPLNAESITTSFQPSQIEAASSLELATNRTDNFDLSESQQDNKLKMLFEAIEAVDLPEIVSKQSLSMGVFIFKTSLKRRLKTVGDLRKNEINYYSMRGVIYEYYENKQKF